MKKRYKKGDVVRVIKPGKYFGKIFTIEITDGNYCSKFAGELPVFAGCEVELVTKEIMEYDIAKFCKKYLTK